MALIIGGTQVLRGVLQLGRNFGAELLGQRLEAEIRDELYISLLGKSNPDQCHQQQYGPGHRKNQDWGGQPEYLSNLDRKSVV